MQRVNSCCTLKIDASDCSKCQKKSRVPRVDLAVRFVGKWLWNTLGHSSLSDVTYWLKLLEFFSRFSEILLFFLKGHILNIITYLNSPTLHQLDCIKIFLVLYFSFHNPKVL